MMLTSILVRSESPNPSVTPTKVAASTQSIREHSLGTGSQDVRTPGPSCLPPPSESIKSNTLTSSLSAQGPVPSLLSSPISVSSPAAPIIRDNSTWQADHWNRGIEKARKSLSEADITTLDSLLSGGNSVDKAVDELKVKMMSSGVDGNQSQKTLRFQKFLRTLEKYGNLVDVCIQHSPEVTALVWGSMRLVIDV